MIRPTDGSIWIPIIATMKIFRPVKRNFAGATAAKKASTVEKRTVTSTMIRLFFTFAQKYGRWIASLKCWIVGSSGNQVGFGLLILSVGLNAVEIIQKTG